MSELQLNGYELRKKCKKVEETSVNSTLHNLDFLLLDEMSGPWFFKDDDKRMRIGVLVLLAELTEAEL